jgi:hypothetical protein
MLAAVVGVVARGWVQGTRICVVLRRDCAVDVVWQGMEELRNGLEEYLIGKTPGEPDFVNTRTQHSTPSFTTYPHEDDAMQRTCRSTMCSRATLSVYDWLTAKTK